MRSFGEWEGMSNPLVTLVGGGPLDGKRQEIMDPGIPALQTKRRTRRSTFTAETSTTNGENSMSKTNQIAMQKDQLTTLKQMLEMSHDRLAEVAPKHLKVERLTRLLLAACSRNPKILDCSPASVLQFAMKCSETGLEPIGAGGAWAIPFENRKHKPPTMELTFIPDYRGLVHCARHADVIVDAWAEVVREKDDFEYELGTDPKLHHKPARGDRGEIESAYCVVVLPSGLKRFTVMDRAEIEAIRNRGPAWKAWLSYKKLCPWNTDEGEMFKKTVVRRAMKMFGGASQHLDTALEADDQATGIEMSAPEPAAVPMPKAIGEVEAAVDQIVSQSQAAQDGDGKLAEGELPPEPKAASTPDPAERNQDADESPEAIAARNKEIELQELVSDFRTKIRASRKSTAGKVRTAIDNRLGDLGVELHRTLTAELKSHVMAIVGE